VEAVGRRELKPVLVYLGGELINRRRLLKRNTGGGWGLQARPTLPGGNPGHSARWKPAAGTVYLLV